MDPKTEAQVEGELSGAFANKTATEMAQMRSTGIKTHWTDWAVKYGTALRATTLASSIKQLEVDALRRTIERVLPLSLPASVLEVGCGNGQNIVALCKMFDGGTFSFTGVDYVPEMIAAARQNAADIGVPSLKFLVGDVLDLDSVSGLEPLHDVVFTDRLLINLDTIELQKRAIDNLAARIRNQGSLILIENSRQTKDAQNDLREIIGLPRRPDAPFNLFFNDDEIVPHLKSRFSAVEIEDFGSLHDILLYVLLPAILGDAGHYDHPMMRAVADLCSKVNIPAGAFGQNRLYHCRGRG